MQNKLATIRLFCTLSSKNWFPASRCPNTLPPPPNVQIYSPNYITPTYSVTRHLFSTERYMDASYYRLIKPVCSRVGTIMHTNTKLSAFRTLFIMFEIIIRETNKRKKLEFFWLKCKCTTRH
jgi:hypothetical protein